MAYWLLKTEPGEYGLDDLAAAGERAVWDGIRNYQARNHLRDGVRRGDLALIYHSGSRDPGVVGMAEVVVDPYPDPSQFDADSRYYDDRASVDAPRWLCVDIRFRERFPRPLTLAAARQCEPLQEMVLLRHGRLSVQPVSDAQWRFILRYCRA